MTKKHFIAIAATIRAELDRSAGTAEYMAIEAVAKRLCSTFNVRGGELPLRPRPLPRGRWGGSMTTPSGATEIVVLNDGETFSPIEGAQIFCVPDGWDIDEIERALDSGELEGRDVQ